MRTNVLIDDDTIKMAMEISGVKTKKEMINRALQEFVVFHSRKDLSDLKGKIKFAKGYNHRDLREGR